MSGSRTENVEEKEKATTLEVWVHVNGYRSNRSVRKTESTMYRGNVIDGYTVIYLAHYTAASYHRPANS
jgi:hypothetical protein